MLRFTVAVSLQVLVCGIALGQSPNASENMALLQSSLKNSSLVHGGRPFHLVLEISPGRKASADMKGKMEVFWAAPDRYKLVLDSPSFHQTKVVAGEQVEEHNEGDFYPRWLDNFVKALFEPVPQAQIPTLVQQKLTGGGTMTGVGVGGYTLVMPRCLEANSENIRVCFDAAKPWLESQLDFTRYVSFKNYVRFGNQNIPRMWIDDIPENIFVNAKVTLLNDLSPAESESIHITQATGLNDRIRTVVLSLKEIESRIETLPEFQWPEEDTEVLEGYMIVYVRTDRTGKIRESYWSSADNYKLQDAGVQLALQTKLKPMLVDGAAVQIEGALVLHFKTHRSERFKEPAK